MIDSRCGKYKRRWSREQREKSLLGYVETISCKVWLVESMVDGKYGRGFGPGYSLTQKSLATALGDVVNGEVTNS